MNCDATDILATHFDFSGVQSRTERQAELPGSGDECQRAMDRAPRSIEGCQNPIAGILD